MLNTTKAIISVSRERAQINLKPQLDMPALIQTFRRQWPIITGSVTFMLLIASLYIAIATPRYTAEFAILIDTQKSQVLARRDVASADHPIMDPGFIDSQTEVLRSDSVILPVVKSLHLAHDPDIFPPGTAWLSKLMSWVSFLGEKPAGLPTESQFEVAAVAQIVRNLKIKRARATNVIQVDFTAYSGEKAAQVANALAEGFMNAELEANYRASRRATKWLQDRLTELKVDALAADQAIQAFKANHNIVDTVRGVMSEQELSDVNGQLVAATEATAEAKARLDRINAISQGDVVDGSVADALQSQIITRLRAQYLDLASRLADLKSKYGPNHGVVLNLQSQMEELRHSVQEELRRIGQSFKSDYEIAVARERSVQSNLDSLVAKSHISNQAQVELKDLESTAQISRNVYESFLSKFREITQQQSFPITDARIISYAPVPDKPSWPKKLLILLGAIVLGILCGGAISTAREFMGNNFRTADDVVNFTGLKCLGILPEINLKLTLRRKIRKQRHDVQSARIQLARYCTVAPFSRFTETLRSVKVCIDTVPQQGKSRIVGIVSSLPREGKTTFAANLGLLTAQTGHKTLLIDGDLHNPTLTATLFSNSKSGLFEVLAKGRSATDVIRCDPSTSLHVIPSVITKRYANVCSLLTSPALLNLLADVRERYEYVFIDLPPAVPIVDVKAISHLIDSFIFLIQWHHTSRKVVREALTNDEQLRDRTLGAVITRADPGALRRIEAYKGRWYRNYYLEPN